jgi:hypothetical protein
VFVLVVTALAPVFVLVVTVLVTVFVFNGSYCLDPCVCTQW